MRLIVTPECDAQMDVLRRELSDDPSAREEVEFLWKLRLIKLRDNPHDAAPERMEPISRDWAYRASLPPIEVYGETRQYNLYFLKKWQGNVLVELRIFWLDFWRL